MELIEIKKFLYESNPHWKANKIDLPADLSFLYRSQFDLLVKGLDKPQILGLIGCRRVGKSVLMQQLMNLLGKTHPAKSICQFSFDEELVGKNPDMLDHLITCFLDELGSDFKGRIFIFIDEIQFVKNWQHILKRYYDRMRNVKFIVSGSSSLFIQKSTTESLAGRIFEYVVPPLAFWEYLVLSNKSLDNAKKLSSLEFDFRKLDFEKAKDAVEEFRIKESSFIPTFDEYLCRGQFPEVVGWEDAEAYDYIKNSIYKKTLLYDIPRVFQIRQPDEIAFLFTILIRESSNLLEINNLAREAGINRNTISAYLGYLKESMLHVQLSNATSSVREERRLLRKGYVPSPNFMSSHFKLDRFHPLWSKESGHLAETFVAGVLWNKYSDALHFYRKDDLEVDFVVTPIAGNLKGSLLFEVKYTDSIDRKDLKPLLSLAQRTGERKAVCITKNIVKIERINNIEILFLPIWAMK